MLKPVPLHDILSLGDDDKAGENIEIEFINRPETKLSDQSIKEIITSNINIQIGLGMFIFNIEGDPEDIDLRENIGFLNNKPIDREIAEIMSIFPKPTLYKVNGEPCFLQVSKPLDKIFFIFEELSRKGKLNQWVSHFMLRKAKNDVTDISGYQFYLDDKSDNLSTYDNTLNEDEFFNYLRFNKRNIANQKCIPVCGHTLEEIDSDPCIRAFSKIVKELYVYISQGITPTQYEKFLTWVE